MRLRGPAFGPLQCQFCKLPSEGTKVFPIFDQCKLPWAHLRGTVSYAWCGACRAERCWDCGAVGKFLTAPIRDDRDYRICEACF